MSIESAAKKFIAANEDRPIDDAPKTDPGEGGNPSADVIIETAMRGFATDPKSATLDAVRRWHDLIARTHGTKTAMDDLIDLQNSFGHDPKKTGEQFRIVQEVIRNINQEKRLTRDILTD